MKPAGPAGYEWLRPPRGTEDIPRGALVRDTVSGRVGVLQDVTLYANPHPVLTNHTEAPPFVRPVGGGREWTTLPDKLVREPQPEPERDAGERPK